MKNITTLLLSLVLIMPFSGKALATEKAKTKIANVKQKGELVLFTLTSSKPFIFGGNKYYLHIGDKAFTRCEQSKSNGKGRITFLIPEGDFTALRDGASIYLTYGNPSVEDGATYEELSKANGAKCWSLGKFNRAMLSK